MTAADIINLSLKDLGIIGESETASAETLSDALTTLNQMLAMWQLDGLYVYAQTETSFTPTGALSYTVGSGGSVNMARPAEIEHAYWREGSNDYEITLLDSFEEYQDIRSKTQAGDPEFGYYNPTYPLGTLYLWPQPASGSIKITTNQPLPIYTASADALTIPPEFEMTVRYSLDEHLSIAMSKPLRPDVAAMAMKTRKMMKRSNLRLQPLKVGAVGGFDIHRGY